MFHKSYYSKLFLAMKCQQSRYLLCNMFRLLSCYIEMLSIRMSLAKDASVNSYHICSRFRTPFCYFEKIFLFFLCCINVSLAGNCIMNEDNLVEFEHILRISRHLVLLSKSLILCLRYV